jgi:alpha-beta hydrolase superfamily lysophospholipase
MPIDTHHTSRRKLILGTASAFAAGLTAASPSLLGASTMPLAPNENDRASKEQIGSEEYRARKGEVALYMFRKRKVAAGGAPPPILFLAHGSSVSSRPTFDLRVPGRGEYSMMDVFARYGFDVWTMDFEGYGRSSRTTGNSDVASGVQDLQAAAAVIAKETGQQRFHLYGESGGALRAGSFAMQYPDRVDRLVLAAFTWTGQGSPTLEKRGEAVEFYKTHNRLPRGREMILSIFTRDKPGTSDPAVGQAMADAEMPFGDTVPTGTYLDMTTKLPLVDPTKLVAPTLIARGEFDGISSQEDLLNFYSRLRVQDRQFNVMPGAAHSLALGTNREQFWHVMKAFLDMPPRRDVVKG